MTEPQLIFLHEGVFRPGRIVPHTESHYIGLDLKRNAILRDEKINPLSLQLVYATALRPLLLVEVLPEIKEGLLSKIEDIRFDDTKFRRKKVQIEQIVERIVEEAQHIAQDNSIPYFSVAAVSASTKPQSVDGSGLSSTLDQYESILQNNVGPQPAREVQYTLHPTVQLYLPR